MWIDPSPITRKPTKVDQLDFYFHRSPVHEKVGPRNLDHRDQIHLLEVMWVDQLLSNAGRE